MKRRENVGTMKCFVNACACLFILHLAFLSACAQKPSEKSAPTPVEATRPSSALKHYEIKPSDLPPPNDTPDAQNGPKVIPQPADARLDMPPGFKISTFAETGDFKRPRWMALAPNGDVFVADHTANSVFILRDADGDGVAETRFVFASNLNLPFGTDDEKRASTRKVLDFLNQDAPSNDDQLFAWYR